MRRHCIATVVILLIAAATISYAQDDGADRTELESPATYDTYTVQSGDSLSDIARRFDTTVEALKAANSIVEAGEIIAGQSLLIPAAEAAPLDFYEVQAGDTLFSIARQFETSVDILQGLNGLGDPSGIFVGQQLAVPAAGGILESGGADSGLATATPQVNEGRYETYIVQRGDTLFDLARLYNTTIAQLRRLNSIEEGADLIIGRSIYVPRVDETVLERYIVQPGDSLYSIAKRYDIDLQALRLLNRLADIRDLRAGQVILLPKLEGRTLAIHAMQAEDTLEKLAERYETNVEILRTLNGIADASLIEVGRTILVPSAQETRARPGFGFGLQVFIDGTRADALAARVKELGADWVKIDVSWAEIETEPDVYSYSALDSMIAAMELAGLKIMLNVHDAPAWSRARYMATLNSQFWDYAGPPEDYADFADFLANMVIRYAGLVDAYEIWKSPNLLKFWSVPVYTRPQEMTADGDYGIPDEIQMGAREYVPLLELAYEAIKSRDEKAMVVAAGLAPVGFNDNYNSIDTVTYLKNMLDEGAAQYSDAIGAVFSASAAPPTLACCDKPPGVDTHYESFLQYYGDLLAFYSETLKERGVELPIIVTQLGWGTADGANLATPAAGYEWLNYTSEEEQALYVTQAYQIAQKLESVSALFLYNLNGCAVGDEEACFFSLEDAAGQERPAFAAYRDVPKSADAA
ncbi:MAG: LysM peptidoglycan-binding domain-containing protein [Chloroflexota bacterium]|nr:LysM peptidoglycan-binding domain-containing protein [Chloroflexota bacterium]MDE2910885.1 LysM peptidoglycan-binding domain-containing protein [Chloroflexota bacterium]